MYCWPDYILTGLPTDQKIRKSGNLKLDQGNQEKTLNFDKIREFSYKHY